MELIKNGRRFATNKPDLTECITQFPKCTQQNSPKQKSVPQKIHPNKCWVNICFFRSNLFPPKMHQKNKTRSQQPGVRHLATSPRMWTTLVPPMPYWPKVGHEYVEDKLNKNNNMNLNPELCSLLMQVG